MSKILIVVDMQNDFISGCLGTDQARDIVPGVINKIKSWDGDIIATKDTHAEDYMYSREGTFLPTPHCIENTAGHDFEPYVGEALKNHQSCRTRYKFAFGDYSLPDVIEDIFDKYDDYDERPDTIQLVGLCTDICVISNALILRARYPELDIQVDASCCAGTSPEMHRAALDVMKSCHVEVLNDD